MKPLKITIATGGTGGHIYPALALASALKNKGHLISFIGNDNKMEATLVPHANFDFYPIKNRGFFGNPIQKIVAIFAQIPPMLKSMQLLKRLQSDRVVVFGGYVSIPVGLAAALKGIPLFLHEQNAIAGLANKVLEPFAKAIAVSYPHSIHDFKTSKTKFLGNPRGALFEKQTNKEAFYSTLGLDSIKETVLLVMGSQGSETINEILKQLVNDESIRNYQMIVVVGKKHYEGFMQDVRINKNVCVVDTINQLEALSYVNLIVCRAGATTVSEIIAAQVPAIFIPSPYVVKNHQFKNIEPLIKQDAAWLLQEKDCSKESLLASINQALNDNQQYLLKQKNMQFFQTPNALSDFIEMIEQDNE